MAERLQDFLVSAVSCTASFTQHAGVEALTGEGGPLLAIPYLIAAFPGRYDRRRYLLYGVGFYALAKVAELLDHEIYAATASAISGHSAKHLLAALAVLCVLRMLQQRQSLTPVASSQ